MKRKYSIKIKEKTIEREYSYIPIRYIIAAIITISNMIGTINMDYRSLVHHFENGVWLHKTESLENIKADILDTIDKSVLVEESTVKTNLFQRLLRSIVRIFAPLL